MGYLEGHLGASLGSNRVYSWVTLGVFLGQFVCTLEAPGGYSEDTLWLLCDHFRGHLVTFSLLIRQFGGTEDTC